MEAIDPLGQMMKIWIGVCALAACTPSGPAEDAVPAELEAVAPVREDSPEPEVVTPEAEEPQGEEKRTTCMLGKMGVPPPKVRMAAGFPKNVHVAYPKDEVGWTVDVTDPYGRRKEERIVKALRLDQRDEYDDVELAPGSTGVPKRWKHGDTWTLVTPRGVRRLRAARFLLREGPGEFHLDVELLRAKTTASRTVLAIRGKGVADDLVFGKPKPEDGAALGEGGVEAVRAAVLGDVKSRDDRRMFKRARIAARHVRLYDGRLPEPYSKVVVLNAPVPKADGLRASAILLLRNDGAVEHVEIADVQGRIRMRAILDINGDGVDEVVYEDSYHEGAYDKLLYFDGAGPKTHTIAGDGA